MPLELSRTYVCSGVGRVLILSACWFIYACTTPETESPRALEPSFAHPETRVMIQILDSLYRSTLDQPFDYYYLNAERAEEAKRQLPHYTGEQHKVLRSTVAVELLYAGQTQDAIDAFGRLLSEIDAEKNLLTADARKYTDLLAIAYLRLGEQQNCILNHSAASCILPLQEDAVHTRPDGSQYAAGVYERLLERYPGDFRARWLLNIAYLTLGRYRSVPEKHLIPGLSRPSQPLISSFSNIAGAIGIDEEGLAGSVAMDDFDNDGLLDLFVTAHRLNDDVRLYLNNGYGRFIDHTAEAGLHNLAGGLNVIHADYDNDGFLDILVLRGAWLGGRGNHPNSLLKNKGDGTFEDVTRSAGLFTSHPTQAAAWADFNNDGWLDLFIGNELSNRWLSVWQQASAFSDSRRHPAQLFMNNGDGSFTDIAPHLGLDVDLFIKGVAWGDANNDGLPDLYLSVMGGPNRFYLNRGGASPEDWRFEEIAGKIGVHEPFFSFPVWFWDYNNDGRLDLCIGNSDLRRLDQAGADLAREYLGLPYETEMPRVYRNDGTDSDGYPRFTDVTIEVDMNRVLFAMGGNFGDLNNDGFEDMYFGTGAPDFRSLVPNRMFLNRAGASFDEVTLDGGFGHLQKGHGIAFGDLDRDGDQDIYAVMGGAYEGDVFRDALFENPGSTDPASWITLTLRGNAANSSAIGARVRLQVAHSDDTTRQIYRTVSTGGSFGSSSLQLEVGLGDATSIEELEIVWPDRNRSTEVYTSLEPNRYYLIRQGVRPEQLPYAPVPFDKTIDTEHVH